MVTFAELRDFVQDRDPVARRLLKAIFLRHGYRDELADEMVGEAIAIQWGFLRRNHERGTLVDDLAVVQMWKFSLDHASRHARAGRRAAGYQGSKPKDVYDAIRTGKIHPDRTHVRELLSTRDAIPDVVALLVDFPAFLATLNSRQVAMLEEFVGGASTNEVAARFEVSAGAVSQFRARLVRLWHEFQHEA